MSLTRKRTNINWQVEYDFHEEGKPIYTSLWEHSKDIY